MIHQVIHIYDLAAHHLFIYRKSRIFLPFRTHLIVHAHQRRETVSASYGDQLFLITAADQHQVSRHFLLSVPDDLASGLKNNGIAGNVQKRSDDMRCFIHRAPGNDDHFNPRMPQPIQGIQRFLLHIMIRIQQCPVQIDRHCFI